jgi:hypothetical protein
MPLLTKISKRLLLLRSLHRARAERLGMKRDAAERANAMRRLLDQGVES